MLAFLRKIRGHQLRVALSALLALAEAIGWVALPFLVGTALDDFMDGSLMGLIVFAAVGLVTMLVAVARRLHDARLYARIYETTAVDAVDRAAQHAARGRRIPRTFDAGPHRKPRRLRRHAGLPRGALAAGLLDRARHEHPHRRDLRRDDAPDAGAQPRLQRRVRAAGRRP